MAPDALRFRQLRLRRMPGFQDGGFLLDDLAEGINIVFGPNASGKTTTARAVEALLWPGAAGREVSALGRFELGGGEWLIDIDSGRIRAQRDGRDVEPPALVATESRDRYRLALPELLTATDADLAAAVLRESAGGYDVAAAAARLGFRSAPSRAQREVGALQAARARVAQARGEQERLATEERRLAELEPELAAAERAARRVRLLELALDHAEARDREAGAHYEVERFPPELEGLRGDEVERLRELQSRIAATRRSAEEAEAARESAEAELAAVRLPDEGVPDGLVRMLREELRRLGQLEEQAIAAEREHTGSVTRRDVERSAIGDEVDDARLAGLQRVRYDVLVEVAERGARLRAERAQLEARERWLHAGEALPDLEKLRRASYRLQDWLRLAPATEGAQVLRMRKLALGLAALAGVAGILLAVLVHPAYALVALAAAGIAYVASRPDEAPPPQQHAQEEYLRIGVAPPEEWTAEGVRRQLDYFEARIAEAALLHERARHWEQLEQDRIRIEEEEEKLHDERLAALHDLGLPGDVDVSWLHLLVNAISRWQAASAEVASAADRLATARNQASALARSIAGRLAPFEYAGGDTAAELQGDVEDLAEREQRRIRARDAIRQVGPAASAARETMQRLEEERVALFAGAGVGPDEEATLVEWCGLHGSHAVAREACRLAEHERAIALARLRAHPDAQSAFEEAEVPALREELEAVRREAERSDPLREEVTRIRTRIAEARMRHDLEAALAEVDDAEDGLRDARERDVAATLGALLAEEVQNQTRDLHRPAVFHRAREELVRITRGHYRLEFDDGQPPAFRARDTATGVGHPLGELSSGTRVQLLMAVRLAFVDTLESGVALPLLFDETLANADDRRAQAIMEATIELAAAGRQVFYFTAQADEVMKWLELLRVRGDVPHRVIDLAKCRNLGEQLELPPITSPPAPPIALPPPEGITYLEYARMLGVSPLDPRNGRVEMVHLWHLLDDAELLHSLLRHGISTWGALEALTEHGGRENRLYEQAHRRAAAAARALEIALPLARIGRGRTVGRAELLDSEAVTDVFLEQVTDLCERYGGDAGRVMQALEAGEVPRFRNASREQLRTYLEEAGCLDLREPLEPQEVRARVLGGVARELEAGVISIGQIDRIIHGLTARKEVETAD